MKGRSRSIIKRTIAETSGFPDEISACLIAYENCVEYKNTGKITGKANISLEGNKGGFWDEKMGKNMRNLEDFATDDYARILKKETKDLSTDYSIPMILVISER